ncbi:MAG: ATP-binding protein [Dehalococcoidia bacterium]
MENLSAISDFIFSTAVQFDIKQDINKIQLAVDEACTNIIKHAYSSQGGAITIFFERNDNTVVITIQDRGKPFDPAAIPPPDLEAEIEKRQIGKLGLHLMRKLMDEISYSFDPEEGNTLVMKKRLNTANQ